MLRLADRQIDRCERGIRRDVGEQLPQPLERVRLQAREAGIQLRASTRELTVGLYGSGRQSLCGVAIVNHEWRRNYLRYADPRRRRARRGHGDLPPCWRRSPPAPRSRSRSRHWGWRWFGPVPAPLVRTHRRIRGRRQSLPPRLSAERRERPSRRRVVGIRRCRPTRGYWACLPARDGEGYALFRLPDRGAILVSRGQNIVGDVEARGGAP